ncbi:hypothetical protein [Sphingomonas sp. BK580]|uniref:hypothetical protein n=1 Tax=Sphingomonas sp. BK580 TaxID=2586972 RepID=UPI001620F279|nr:hypothetical protein [Sphingomonas sp. BK580]MBB3694816.1 hypothetical protein [Sphingomonas sp. BK580]
MISASPPKPHNPLRRTKPLTAPIAAPHDLPGATDVKLDESLKIFAGIVAAIHAVDRLRGLAGLPSTV